MRKALRWRYAAASVTGVSHLRSNADCQDECSVRIFETWEGPVLVLAVSDGAGSARLGEIGSSIAVAGVIEQAAAWFADCRTANEITEMVIREWVRGVQEQIAEQAAESQAEMRDYAATLLLAILGPKHSVFAQLGDGALVVLTPELDWSWVFWPMHGEYCNTTFFITDATALETLQVECQDRAVHEVAAFTDGLEALVLDFKERTAFHPFFARMFKPLRASSTAGADRSLNRQLAEYLRSAPVATRADDDLTLVLATCVDPPSALPTPAP